MAINISEKYPGRSNPPSVDYPQGSIKNQTAPGARDGTPLDEAWANDKEGFFQKALAYRGATANGTPDTAVSSQYFDAVFADPTETLRGMPLVATAAETAAGIDDGKVVTPKKLKDAYQLPVGQSQTWQNLSSSRSLGVTYTNSTGRTICVLIRTFSGQFVYFSVNGGIIGATRGGLNSGASIDAVGSYLVPTGASYSATQGPDAAVSGFGTWQELR